MPRERDVRNDLKARLIASNLFGDAVWLTGDPSTFGQASSDTAAASIEPVSTTLTTGWDSQPEGVLVYAAQLGVTLLARNDDPQLRDELAEALLEQLKNSADGQSLAAFTVPGLTRVINWAWQTPTPPERRIRATVAFSYLESGWDVGDTSE